jgi:hypothetical protein
MRCSLGEAEVSRTTDKALLVYIDDLGEEVWIPKSVIHDDSEVYSSTGSTGELIVHSWWAEKNGYA